MLVLTPRFRCKVLWSGISNYRTFGKNECTSIYRLQETKVGDSFADKSVFPYKPNDIFLLVKAVLRTISKLIEEHFEKNNERSFYRKGERAIMLFI